MVCSSIIEIIFLQYNRAIDQRYVRRFFLEQKRRWRGLGRARRSYTINKRAVRLNLTFPTSSTKMAWVPIVSILGDLPLTANELAEFPIPKNIHEMSPKQILVYTFITMDDVMPGFQRGYYEVFTKRNDGTEFKLYMNVAMTRDAVLNSENMWLPYGTDFDKFVYVRLNGAEGTKIAPKEKKIKSCQGKDAATVMKEHAGHCHDDADGVQVGQIMITGYRV